MIVRNYCQCENPEPIESTSTSLLTGFAGALIEAFSSKVKYCAHCSLPIIDNPDDKEESVISIPEGEVESVKDEPLTPEEQTLYDKIKTSDTTWYGIEIEGEAGDFETAKRLHDKGAISLRRMGMVMVIACLRDETK